MENNEFYTFKIWSKNKIGLSRNYSVIEVPPYGTSKKPIQFSKIDMGNSLYELKWKPSPGEYVQNYTLFWCENDRDRPYVCEVS